MYIIENETLRVEVNPLGAELSSLFNKSTGLEYIWSGDPVFWGKKSPVLFPIVGNLKDNQYFVDGKSYEMNRHGFAREKMFTVVSCDLTSFRLKGSKKPPKQSGCHLHFCNQIQLCVCVWVRSRLPLSV